MSEAIEAGITINDVYARSDDEVAAELAATAGREVTKVSDDVLAGMASSVNPRGPVTIITIPGGDRQVAGIDSLVLWDIADPGNAGTMIRTAAAFGFQVLATKGTVDLWSPKVLRAAVGGHFRTTLVEGLPADVAPLAAAGLTAMVATADGAPANDVRLDGDHPVALLVGNEAHGVPDAIASTGNVQTITLPMPGGSESLNAAVSAGILMYLRMVGRSD
ncbi:MAG: RNA methyltransferase [bacterium]|nr:RNA methyltransferase [bacterium]